MNALLCQKSSQICTAHNIVQCSAPAYAVRLQALTPLLFQVLSLQGAGSALFVGLSPSPPVDPAPRGTGRPARSQLESYVVIRSCEFVRQGANVGSLHQSSPAGPAVTSPPGTTFGGEFSCDVKRVALVLSEELPGKSSTSDSSIGSLRKMIVAMGQHDALERDN